jgi:hypothetical protein
MRWIDEGVAKRLAVAAAEQEPSGGPMLVAEIEARQARTLTEAIEEGNWKKVAAVRDELQTSAETVRVNFDDFPPAPDPPR